MKIRIELDADEIDQLAEKAKNSFGIGSMVNIQKVAKSFILKVLNEGENGQAST